MLPKYHIVLSFFVFAILLLIGFSPIPALIVAVSSVLIDVDHYVFYIIKKRDISLKRAYVWFIKNYISQKNKKPYEETLCIFHTFEVWIILIFLSFFNQYIMLIYIGFLFHLITDFTYLIIAERENLRLKYFSLIYYISLKKTCNSFLDQQKTSYKQ